MNGTRNPSANRPAWIAVGLVALAAIVVGLPTLRGTFVGADDHKLVLNHVLVNHPSWSHAWQLLTIIHRDLYQPIPLLSFSLEFAIAGRLGLFDEGLEGGAWFFHATNVLLHTVNAVFVWFMIRRVYAANRNFDESAAHGVATSQIVPTTAAMIFAIHPLQVEVIAWINGRMMLLAILFGLAAILSLGRWLDSRRVGWCLATVVFALLSAMSKARVELPALMLLCAWTTGRTWDRRFWSAWVPSTLATAAIAFINRRATEDAGLFSLAAEELQGSTIARSVIALAWYVRHFLWPTGLAPSYPPPTHVSWSDTGTLISMLIVAPLVLWTAYMVLRGTGIANSSTTSTQSERAPDTLSIRRLAFGPAWFFLGIASTLPVVLPRKLLAADRYMYLAIIGLAWLSAVVAMRTWFWIRSRMGLWAARAFVGAGTACAAALIATSWTVATHYESFVNKAERIVELFPEHAFVWERLAWGYYNTGEYNRAMAAAKEALSRNGGPQVDCGAYQVIGLCHKEHGRREEALASLRMAVEVEPRNHLANYRLGQALDEFAGTGEGLPYYLAAVESAPGFNPAWLRIAAVYRQRGDTDRAREAYEQAVKNNPYEVPAILGLAELDIDAGTPTSYAAAEKRLRQLLDWMPENTVARTNLGIVQYATGRTREAIQSYRDALDRDPRNQTAMLNLAQLYVAAGDAPRAQPLFEQLAFVDVLSLEQALVVHDVLAGHGRFREAQRFWNKQSTLLESSPDARAMAYWADALAGSPPSVLALAELCERHPQRPAVWASRIYVELASGRYDAAMAASDQFAHMTGAPAVDFRRRLLTALEYFDSQHPDVPWTFHIVAVQLIAEDQREPALAAIMLFEESCVAEECAPISMRLREQWASKFDRP